LQILLLLSRTSLINFQENWLLGFDLQGDILKQGVWIEAAYNKMREYNGQKDDYLRYVLGADYRFNEVMLGFAEYQYNGAGVTDSDNYVSNVNTLAYLEGGVFYLSKNYLSAGLSWQFSPLLNFSATQLFNLDDHSNYIIPKAEWNFSENFYLDLTLYAGIGVTGSEFDSYSDRGMISIRGYF